MPPTLSIVAMSDRQERRRQLTRARVENWRACQDARGVVARILHVADRPLVGIARRPFSEGKVLQYSLGCMIYVAFTAAPYISYASASMVRQMHRRSQRAAAMVDCWTSFSNCLTCRMNWTSWCLATTNVVNSFVSRFLAHQACRTPERRRTGDAADDCTECRQLLTAFVASGHHARECRAPGLLHGFQLLCLQLMYPGIHPTNLSERVKYTSSWIPAR